MGSEEGLKSVKVGLLPAPHTLQPKRVHRFPHRNRAIAVGVLIGVALWFVHGRYTFTPEYWPEDHLDLFGYDKYDSLTGNEAEELFLKVPNAASAIAFSRKYTAKPHLAGSKTDYDTAVGVLEATQKHLGITPPDQTPVYSAGTPESRNATLNIPFAEKPFAWIDRYYPVLNTPLDRHLEILNKDGIVAWKANLEEVVDQTDEDAHKYFDAVPTWHGLSKDGNVTGQLIYAGYGTKREYDDLAAAGTNFTGKIVITRYGKNFRGLKVKGAQELGAAGVLIYSDLRDDGSVTAETGYEAYPHGPARNPHSVQRGSVQFLSMYPGDPTTPGFPSYEDANRTRGENIPSIPSLPISWANAQVLLKEIQEGGANRTVRLVNHVDQKITPIWNTMAYIPGHLRDEVVVVGNHRDAWVLGASDPTSGTVSLNEVIRGLGALYEKGWRPHRTILIASWDAEEYGLIGSTEWGEDFADWIQEHVVAYLNLDLSVSGSRYTMRSSPSFAHLVRDTAKLIAHPTVADSTLWDARNDRGKYYGNLSDEAIVRINAEMDVEITDNELSSIKPLGSGSDFTVFLQRIGIASVGFAFSSTLSDAVYHYHSVFDSERWMEMYGDPGFAKHVAAAQHLGLQILRLADSWILPINTTHYSIELQSYLDKVEDLAEKSSIKSQVNLHKLRHSLWELREASSRLDKEKVHAYWQLKKALWRLRHHNTIRHKLRKAYCKIRRWFGKKCHKKHGHKHRHGHRHRHEHEHGATPLVPSELVRGDGHVKFKPRIGRLPGWIKEQGEQAGEHHGSHRHPGRKTGLGRCRHGHKEAVRAAKHVRDVNKRLSKFEQGFISEDGIKDREWYRHLGVAPGKWLGYGATTFPALTESITIENNATQAEYEVKRLEVLVDGIIKSIGH